MGQGSQGCRNKRGVNVAVLLCACAASAVAPPVAAQPYPARPIRLISPAPPGGSTDTLARVVGTRLAEAFGQQVIVDNRPGAGSVIGTELVARAVPDGYTLGVVYTTHTTNASLQKLPYDPVADFSPITMLTSAPLVLVVPTASSVQSVRDLLAAARARPLAYGSAGVGSGGHLSGELLRMMTGINITHVPYKGAAPAATDVAGGHLAFQFAAQITVQAFLTGHRLRAVAVTSAKRAASLPDVPTVAESGVAGFEVLNWFGMLAPARTPAAIVTRLNSTIVKLLQRSDVREKLTSEGSGIIGSTPEQFAAFLKEDVAKWARVIKAAGIKID
jgi:tripartite-type tricarboxylate transporter receptor subunit TctC